MTGRKYTVEFRIFSNTLDPAEISKDLGLQPCQVRMKDTLRADGKLCEAMWAYDGGRGSTDWDSLSDGLSFLLEILWPHRELIAKYRMSGKLVWWCGNFQSSFDGGPWLSAALLKRLGEFGAELYIDNYFSER